MKKAITLLLIFCFIESCVFAADYFCTGSSMTSSRLDGISGGEVIKHGLILEKIELSEDGTDFNISLLEVEKKIDAVSGIAGELNDIASKSNVDPGTYTHIRLTISGQVIQGWVTDGINTWHTIEDDTQFTMLMQSGGSQSAPSNYGSTSKRFSGNSVTTIKLAKPLVVEAGKTSTLIFAEKNLTPSETTPTLDFGEGDYDQCEASFLSIPGEWYRMYITERPNKYVRIEMTDGTKEHWISFLYNSDGDLLGGSSHRRGNDWLVNASFQKELSSTGNIYNESFNATFSSGDPNDYYTFTGEYTCGTDQQNDGTATNVSISDKDSVAVTVNSTANVYCESFQ